MRLLFAINNLCAGGGEKVMSSLVNELSTIENLDIHMACFHSSDKFSYFYHLKETIPVHLIEYGNIDQLVSVISAFRPEVVVSFLNPMNYLCSLATRSTGTRHIACERNNPYKSPYRVEDRKMRDEAFEKSDGCVFQTEEAMGYFINKLNGVYTIIDNPICLCLHEKYSETSIRFVKKIVSVGRYAEQKNYTFLIKVFSMFKERHPDFILECYGKDSGFYPKIKQCVADYGLENSVYLFKETPFVHDCIKDAKAFLFTSTHEGTPNALMEAAALGIPCVASNLPEISRINKECPFAVLCSLDDPREFVSALELVIYDDQYAMSLKQNGIKLAKLRNIKKIAKQWLEFINITIATSL